MSGKKAVSFLFLGKVYSAVFIGQMLIADAWVPAMFVFGDSTADVGNNNYLSGDGKPYSLFKANYPHNGIDYPNHTPTGRFSNGYNGVDFLAKMLGFTESPPPFLSLTSQSQVLQGVNFASGGSGILDTTGQIVSISMNKQIDHFEGIITNRLTPQMGKPATDRFISESLFFFSTGNNDMFGFYAASGPQNSNQSEQFISLLSSQFKDQLKRLYELGARKFAVTGASYIGCVPYLRSRNPAGSCIEYLNDLAQQFNVATKENLEDLSSTLEGTRYSFADTYEMMSTVKQNPILFGYKEIEIACCGGGNSNGESGCTPFATYCSNRKEYFYWDWFHPTEATYKLVTQLSFYGLLRFATPINIMMLTLI